MGRVSLRDRNRLHTMRLVQHTAVELFESVGFEITTIETIADSCGVSASTIYRHFGTKEHLLLWDEREPVVVAELTRRLPLDDPADALRDSAIAAFAERDDLEMLLRRLRIIYTDESIWTAAVAQDLHDRAELAAGIARAAGRRHPTIIDEVHAACCLAALDVAFDQWQRSNGAADLSDLITSALGAVSPPR